MFVCFAFMLAVREGMTIWLIFLHWIMCKCTMSWGMLFVKQQRIIICMLRRWVQLQITNKTCCLLIRFVKLEIIFYFLAFNTNFLNDTHVSVLLFFAIKMSYFFPSRNHEEPGGNARLPYHFLRLEFFLNPVFVFLLKQFLFWLSHFL